MLNRIRQLFQQNEAAGAANPGEHPHAEVRLAAAALLVEAASLDGAFDADERAAVARVLQSHFELNEDELSTLMAAAETRQAESNQLLAFTRAIKAHYSPEERIEIIEMLWEVAYADGVLHDYEANLLRRVGGLIYVPDRERGAARQRVLARLGIAGD